MDNAGKKEKRVKKFSRVPQAFVFDNKALYRKFEKSASIVQDLMIFYNYNKLNTNLFGEFEFTIKDFCDAMGYNRTNLQRSVEIGEDAVLDDHVCDSLFEYSLFRCLKENVVLRRKKDSSMEYRSYKLLDKLAINYDKTSKKQQRRSYTIKFSKEFSEGVFKEYFVLDYEDYSRIYNRKLELMGADRNFYLIVCKMIAIIRNLRYNARKEGYLWNPERDNAYRSNIDMVCSQLGIEIQDPKNKKRKLKARLENIQSEIQNTPFTFEFEKQRGENNTEIFVVFRFTDEIIEYFDEKQKAKFIFKLISKCSDQYARINLDYKAKIMSCTITEEDEEKFFEWFSSSEHMDDFSIIIDGRPYPALGKFSIFKSVYQEIYEEPYPGDKIDLSLLVRK